jgi:hypothetical protein
MFAGVKTIGIMPILEEGYVANRIIIAIRQEEPVVFLPFFSNLHYFVKAFLPISVQDWLARVLGLDSAMDTFTGRKSAVVK